MKSAEKENLRMNIDYFYITFIVLKKDNIILKEEVILYIKGDGLSLH